MVVNHVLLVHVGIHKTFLYVTTILLYAYLIGGDHIACAPVQCSTALVLIIKAIIQIQIEASTN